MRGPWNKKKGIALAVAFFGILVFVQNVFAYSRDPSGNPAEETVTFTVDPADYAANCDPGSNWRIDFWDGDDTNYYLQTTSGTTQTFDCGDTVYSATGTWGEKPLFCPVVMQGIILSCTTEAVGTYVPYGSAGYGSMESGALTITSSTAAASTSTAETVSVQAIERIYYAIILTGIFGVLLWKK